MKLLKGQIRFFGKTIPVFTITLLMLIGVGSAALLTYYGQITGSATVQQSILIDGQDYTATITHTVDGAPGGKIFCYKHKLTNQMSVPGAVKFETSYSPDGDGITTIYYDLRKEVTGGDNDVNNMPAYQCEEGYINQRGQMVFKGTLTPDGNGGYTGRIPSICAFDVFAKQGSCAYVEGYYGTGDWNCEGEDTFTVGYYGNEVHDAYPSEHNGGPWGSYYDPDVADADEEWSGGTHYYLNLNSDGTWSIEYLDTGNTPYSGIVNWDTQIALETGQAWNVQWTWGEEYIRLQHPAWKMEITQDGSEYVVLMTPVGVETTSMTLGSGESADFALCYEFDKAIEPGAYTITTQIIPY